MNSTNLPTQSASSAQTVNSNKKDAPTSAHPLAYDEVVAQLTENIQNLMKSEKDANRDPASWPLALYAHYANRFLADNERIWSTASVLIPVSLAGFAALVTIQDIRLAHVIILMFGSISLMFIWLMIAEGHRAFQRKSQAWLQAIEAAIGLEKVGKAKLPENSLNRAATSIRIQAWRWIFFALIVIGWLGVLALTLLDYL